MKNKLNFVLDVIAIALFVGAGINTLVLKFAVSEMTPFILAIILLVGGIAKIGYYLLRRGFKSSHNLMAVGGLSMVILSAFFFTEKLDLNALCLAWGIMEIGLGLMELYIDLWAARKDKLAFGEVAIDLGTLTFAVILTIKLAHGLNGHLIFMGASFFLYGILLILEMVRDSKKEKEE